MSKCQESGCTVICARFNYPGQTKGIRCHTHKLPDMINISSRKCEDPGCIKIASFSYPGETKPVRCSTHKLDNMVNTKSSICEQPDCNMRPIFNYPGQKKSIRCINHKAENMVVVAYQPCEEPGCIKYPTFNYPGEKRAVRCLGHMKKDMVDVINRKCEEPGCHKHPSFNYSGQRTGSRCSEHKIENMIDVVSRTCEEPGCTKQSTFNYPGQKKAIRCYNHKGEGMINVIDRKCEEPGCNTRPHFNYVGQEKGVRCFRHKLPNMVNVTSKTCLENGCNRQAIYGKLFGPKEHCSQHRKSSEYKISHPKCSTKGCNDKPMYTNKGDNYPCRCENHKLLNDKNVIERPCAKCQLPDYINEVTLLCNSCSDFFIRNHNKVKEKRIITLVESNGFKFDSLDRPVDGGCTKYRPDGLIDFGLLEVNVEVDEDQHKSYPPECEIIRMIMIHQDFGGKPVIFIRFNPDSYESPIKSINYRERERILLDLLNSFRNVKEIEYPLLVCYLFYDGYDGQIRFKSLDPFSKTMAEILHPFV